MKKYFLKGKEFLTKKLEELQIETSSMDYVQEQLPNRLKEPLSVLRDNQIDLQDSNQYETYFKNYPNHHLSHFLLEKYKALEEAETQPQPYSPPENKDSYIPPFDQKFEKKALLFRQAIQQYDEGYNAMTDPLICICVIHFHHKRGTEIEYRYPQSTAVQKIENMIIHHAMPDSSHNKSEDYNYFNFESEFKGKKRMLFGVSYFKQIKLTEQMKKNNAELTRSYVQKAVAVVSMVPLFGYLKFRLTSTTKVFFQQFTNFEIIQSAYKDMNKNLSDTWPQTPLNDLYIGSDLKVIIDLFGVSDFYEIWKAILYQRRVVVFAHSSSSASSFIVSLMSLFPGLSTFGIYSKPIAKYMQSLREYALPLKTFTSDNFLSMSFHIQDFGLLAKFIKKDEGNFLLGTTNRLLKQSNDYGIQLLVNLENCTIQKKKARRPWQSLNKKQKNFIHELEQLVQKQKSFNYGGSEDNIRNHFHHFVKGTLIDMMISIKSFRKFVTDCEEYEKNLKIKEEKPMRKKSGGYQFMDEENEGQQKKQECQNNNQGDFPPLLPSAVSHMMFPNLLLNKSFNYFLQFHNQDLPDIVLGKLFPSLYINDYNYLLRISAEQFISYNWFQKKLSFGKGVPKNFDGKQIRFDKKIPFGEGKAICKSIYIGILNNGKFNKNGFYMDEFQHYEGEFVNGMRNGHGRLTTGTQKYIGEFQNDLYEGEGQLIVGDQIYSGHFKQGLRHGFGHNQGKINFEGEWKDDQPVILTMPVQLQMLPEPNKSLKIQNNDKIEGYKKQKQQNEQIKGQKEP